MDLFSHSRIGLFEKCPKAYELKYIEDEEEHFDTIEQHMGSAVHEALEWAYLRRETKTPSNSMILDTFRAAFHASAEREVRVIKKGRCKDDYFREGKVMLERFLVERFAGDQSETVALEHEFVVPLTDELGYRGIIDRVARQPDQTLVLLDYKTGKRIPDPVVDRQLPAYALWAFDALDDTEVEVAFEDLRGARRVSGRIRESDSSRIAASIVASINQATSASFFPSDPSHLCRWCGFAPVCPDAHASVPRAWRQHAAPVDEYADPDTCPRCGGGLEERTGRNGDFIGCSEYPDCRYTRNDW